MRHVICFECGSENEYELRKSLRQYEGDGYCFTMEVELPFCKKCGAPLAIEEIEEAIAEKANKKIRESRGIIQKDEIVEILSHYNVSQKFLSRLLGWGEITLTRYISGGYTPNKVNSEKLKSLENPYVLQNLLNEKLEEIKEDYPNETLVVKLQKSINKNIEEMEAKSGKIYEVVNWFLSHATNEDPITHLALQKLLYFSQCWNKIWNDQWLFENECEAWVHGAVYRKVYEEFKRFKHKPLPKVTMETSLEKCEIEVLEFVKKYYFDVYTARTLENICHLERPYKLARAGYQEDENCTEVMKKGDIEDYYAEIAVKYNISRKNPEHVKKYLNQLLA